MRCDVEVIMRDQLLQCLGPRLVIVAAMGTLVCHWTVLRP
jgi:hypothetical protein